MNHIRRTAAHRALSAALAFAAALCLCAPVRAVQPAPPPITRITVQGNQLLSREHVLDALGLRPGEPFDLSRVESAVQQFNSSGIYGTVGFSFEPAVDGVDLVFNLAEGVRLTAVRFEGNERFSARRLEELTGLSVGTVLRAADIRPAERRIAGAYRDEGFPAVTARGRLVTATERARVLTFLIAEGARSWVERIEFGGNEQVPGRELIDSMQSDTRGWPAWLWPGWFDEAVFRADLIALEHAYRNRGFLDAKVDGRVVQGSEPGCVVLHVTVQEGALYLIGDVRFEGNTLFRDDELLKAVPLDPGEPYRPDRVEEALDVISSLYADQGHWDVTAARGTLEARDVLPETGTDVSLRFRIREGEPVYIRQVHVRGLTKTKEMVVRRNLTFYPGERASAAKLRESERALLNSGYFDRTLRRPAVQITLEPAEGTLRDAIVRVQEGPTGRLMLTAGVGSETGILGGLSIEEDNFDFWNWPSSWADFWHGNAFRGAGHRVAISLNTGTQRSYYSITFENPSLWNSEYSFGTSLYSRGMVRNEFDETRTGLSLTAGQRMARFARRSVTVGYETIDVDNITTPAPAELLKEKGSHGKPYVRVDASVDRRDNRYAPSEGHYVGGSLELAAGAVGALKARIQGEEYWTMRDEHGRRKHVIGVRGQAATLLGGDVPVYERLYAGGFSTLRGFAFEGVSPSDKATGVLVGGKSMAIGSAEYSLPLTESDALRLVAFCDAGTVCEGMFGALLPLSELRLSLGAGLRWHVPALGPAAMEFDLAVPLMKQPDDLTQLFHFSLAAQRRF